MAKRARSERKPVEALGDAAGADEGRFPQGVEWDPDAPAASASSLAEAPSAMAGLLEADEGFFKARNELLARLGGGQAFMASAAGPGEPGAPGSGNFRGVGVGVRSVAGGYTGDLCVKVFVAEKIPQSRLDAAYSVPEDVNGYPTDVEVVGEWRAFSYTAQYPRPVPCGVSCGHFKITAGTIGCTVMLDNDHYCILSNNHVLANENRAVVGDAIIQPGKADLRRPPDLSTDRIATLERFVPLNFFGVNEVDAAVAWTAARMVRRSHVTYTLNPTPVQPVIGLHVMKNGRTTQATQGIITAIGVDNSPVTYSSGTAWFNDQIVIQGIGGQRFSAPGDSGSLIAMVGTRQPVGLLFAGGSSHTLANPIATVMARLGIKRFLSE